MMSRLIRGIAKIPSRSGQDSVPQCVRHQSRARSGRCSGGMGRRRSKTSGHDGSPASCGTTAISGNNERCNDAIACSDSGRSPRKRFMAASSSGRHPAITRRLVHHWVIDRIANEATEPFRQSIADCVFQAPRRTHTQNKQLDGYCRVDIIFRVRKA